MKLKYLYPIFKLLKILLVLSIVLNVFNLEVFSQATSKKQKARISLEFISKNNSNRQLIATVKTKIDRSYQVVSDVKVKFYYNEVGQNNLIGVKSSDNNGMSILDLPDESKYYGDVINKFNFIATIEEDPNFRDTSREIEIYDSKLELNFIEEDSLRIINVRFTAEDSIGNYIPKEDLVIKLYIKRMFGDLLINDDFDTTDENGLFNFNFTGNILGDENGDISVVAKIEDDDNFGTVLFENNIQWGDPLKVDDFSSRRELWTARANTPLSLLIFVNGMIIGVWSTIVYIIFQILKIRKIGKTERNNKTIA
jgi:hypothetical protein